MNNDTDTARIATPSFADRARFSASREGAPVMPAVVNRPAPRSRRNSVKHRAIR